jgi:hypothetical protein
MGALPNAARSGLSPLAPQAPRAIGRHQGFGRRGAPSAIALPIQLGGGDQGEEGLPSLAVDGAGSEMK